MGSALQLSKTKYSLFQDTTEDMALQTALDDLFFKRISWRFFKERFNDPLIFSRVTEIRVGRTLLHLAVLDNQLDWIQLLRKDPVLRARRDVFGLSPIDLAMFLNRLEALHLLEPLSEIAIFPNLPTLDQFEYLPSPIFETTEGLEETLSHAAKAKKEDKIPSEKIWMGIYFDKEIRKGLHPPVSIRKIDDEIGFGVFADKKIPPCIYAGEYTGVIKQRTQKQLQHAMYSLRYTTWDGRKNYVIDAESQGNFTRFINHSSHPNLGVQSVYWRGVPRMIFISLQEIEEGAQLTFDYGSIYWKNCKTVPKAL